MAKDLLVRLSDAQYKRLLEVAVERAIQSMRWTTPQQLIREAIDLTYKRESICQDGRAGAKMTQ